jgi:hypothetical protein
MLRCIIAAALTVALGGVAGAQTAIVCGPAVARCGPAIVGVPGAASGVAAPSWVNAMLAAWMLDETSGSRVNLQGTTSRDFANVDGTDPGSSTDHQEGTRSISIVAAQARHTTDTFSSLVSPVAMGCWVKMAATPTNDAAMLMHNFAPVGGTVRLDRVANTGALQFSAYDSGSLQQKATSAPVTNNVWHHAAGTMTSGGTINVYVDGVLGASAAMTAAIASANPVYVGDNYVFTGLIDECWIANLAPSAASMCRICSCGIRGEQCTCSGTAFASTGRNATACGACTLPADCSAAAPS